RRHRGRAAQHPGRTGAGPSPRPGRRAGTHLGREPHRRVVLTPPAGLAPRPARCQPSLMERRITDSDFKRHQKIVAAVPLEGVPAGTPGRIMMVNGFAWTRYRVRFENGVERGTLDG